MTIEKDWITFSGFRGLAKWLLESDAGERFVSWFVRRNYRRLLSTRWGADFYDWVLRQAQGDLNDRAAVCVVECNPDGYIRVFASTRMSVVWVDRLDVPLCDQQFQALDEEWAALNIPHRAKAVWNEDRHLLSTHIYEKRKPSDVLRAQSSKQIHDAVSRAIAARSGSKGD